MKNAKINEILPNLFNCILTELPGTLEYKTNNVHVLNAVKHINDKLLAKDMLTSNELSLQDIVYSLGYENYRYFNKVFKKHFGISPIKIKNELKEK